MVLLVAAAVALAACDDADDSTPPSDADDPTAPAEGPDESSDGDEPGASQVDLPPVVRLDPVEVEDDAAGGDEADDGSADAPLDDLVRDAVGDLPDGWQVAVVPDGTLGPYVVGIPADAVVWRSGDDLGELRAATETTDWGDYWLPIAEDAGASADSSSLRAIVVLDDTDDVVSVQINATGVQDLLVDDPLATAQRFAESFEQQGLDVDEVDVATAGEREVGTVRYRTPDDEFDSGVARRVEQWFHPEPDGELLWSVVCDAPVTQEAAAEESCRAVLRSFRPPPR